MMASLNPWEGHRMSDIMSDTGSQEDEDEDAEFTYPGVTGDYSTQLEELFDGEQDSESGEAEQRSDEDFLYDGLDSNTSISYKDQLREVLGQEEADEKEDESLAYENGAASHEDDEPLVCVPSSMNSNLLIVTDSDTQMGYSSKDPQMLIRQGYCRQIPP
jgi:hypothetical protein